MPLEAMARGVPFIYHNPHQESVRTYQQPAGAFETTTGAADLRTALESIDGDPAKTRAKVEEFFTNFVDVDPAKQSERRGAEAIAGRLEA